MTHQRIEKEKNALLRTLIQSPQLIKWRVVMKVFDGSRRNFPGKSVSSCFFFFGLRSYLPLVEQGGKHIPPGDFPWKRMTSSLADDGLYIEGYPAHKCLMPGEYSTTSSKSKGIGGLTREGIAALVEALKAGTMRIVKSTSRRGLSLGLLIIIGPILLILSK
jgi:hypothetical protein